MFHFFYSECHWSTLFASLRSAQGYTVFRRVSVLAKAGSPKSVFRFLTLSSLFPGFPSHSDGILARFQLGKCLKYIYCEKSADSVQRWKLVWFCACKGTLGIGTKAFKQIFLKHLQKLTYNLPCT